MIAFYYRSINLPCLAMADGITCIGKGFCELRAHCFNISTMSILLTLSTVQTHRIVKHLHLFLTGERQR